MTWQKALLILTMIIGLSFVCACEDDGDDAEGCGGGVCSCVTLYYENVSCIDYREADGWTVTTAQEACDGFTDDGAQNMMMEETCLTTSDPDYSDADTIPYTSTKRCIGDPAKIDGPGPQYVYSPNLPDAICTGFIGDDTDGVDSQPYDPTY